MSGNITEPPLRTMLPYKSFIISTTYFMMELLEKNLLDETPEPLCSYGDHLALWQFIDTKLVVKGVVPAFLHVILVVANAMFKRVRKCENTSCGLGFIINIDILLDHPNHNNWALWPANNADRGSLRTGAGCNVLAGWQAGGGWVCPYPCPESWIAPLSAFLFEGEAERWWIGQ
ncbi:hypothetical protein IEQ34_012721 [Dendrobium chrysotoxum]|uniref:Uncharacterized protein n=1 Tax=Dendrobium chrysotoxum TaxID=161865 RepID=A0AAV7GLL3_DENCH|nr:hypothetical protein IEQ34_012721 [Dendrobium chrysotoxum]